MKVQNGFGSIVCLDKTGKKRRKPFAVRITTGWKDGKQQRKYLGYYKTQAEALIALAEYHKGGYDVDTSNLTLMEVYKRWIKRIEPKVSKGVLDSHKMAEKRFEKLGSVPIKNIKTDQLQDWMDNIDLKSSSKNRVKNTLSQLFDYAVSNDIVVKNYVKGVEIDNKVTKTGAVFTDDEIRVLWENKHHQIARWILIMIYTGMRIGELLTLETKNIFLDKGYAIGGNKTEYGIDRTIPFHNKIIPLIKEELSDHKMLITNRNKSVPYANAKRWFDEFMGIHGWNHKPHDARKTGVSIMHSAGIPMETVRVIVGHSGKGVTEQVYLYKESHELVQAINMIQIEDL